MTPLEIREIVVSLVGAVAPEADVAHVDGNVDLRDALDIDSMDFLNILVGIDETFGVAIPERDYHDVRTLDALVGYVAAVLAGAPSRVATG